MLHLTKRILGVTVNCQGQMDDLLVSTWIRVMMIHNTNLLITHFIDDKQRYDAAPYAPISSLGIYVCIYLRK